MVFERIMIRKKEIQSLEAQLRFQAHVQRYASVRRFIYGNVVDFACGCGYGTHLLSMNPDVKEIVGYDKDEKSIEHANNEYSDEKCSFICGDIVSHCRPCDTLVSLETIEHFDNNYIYLNLFEKCSIDQVIVSYPNKNSTHFNKFHKRDLVLQELCDAFGSIYVLLHYFTLGDVDIAIFLKKPLKMPTYIYRNIGNLR